MSKQSNEVMAAVAGRKHDGRKRRPGTGNHEDRDEFFKAKNHADNVLGLDEKVSDGLRRSMERFKNSPLTLMMEILNDEEQPWDRRLDAAERAKPYLHRKLEDKHGTTQGGSGDGAGANPRSTGPTVNLTVNRPRVTVNTREAETAPSAPAKETTSAKHEREQSATAARSKAFKKPKKIAK